MNARYEVTIRGVMSEQHIAALSCLCDRQLDPATGLRLTDEQRALHVMEQILTKTADELTSLIRVAFHMGTQDRRPWNADGVCEEESEIDGVDLSLLRGNDKPQQIH